VTYFSRRLPHALTHADLAVLLTPTYAAEVGVEEDEALERLRHALAVPAIADDLYQSVSTALAAAQGTRSEDELMDRLAKGVAKRAGKMKAAPATQGLAAFMVWVNVELGQAPEQLRATLETDKGRALLNEGLRALGAHLVKSLLS
jgi:hypothetical protein